MRIISAENKEFEEVYLCRPGSRIDSFKVKKIFLWPCEITDSAIQKMSPNTTWAEYERYLMTRFPDNSSKIIKITKNPLCKCDKCKS